uniref:Uncharacterized protein n=1 Tax=Aegilops tauschii subsp. strangulata TaxID=200361 RepID=A0A452ZAH7_AEGTS
QRHPKRTTNRVALEARRPLRTTTTAAMRTKRRKKNSRVKDKLIVPGSVLGKW